MKLGQARNPYEQDELPSPSESLRDRLGDRIAAESGSGSIVSSSSGPLPQPQWDELALGISYQLLATATERDRVCMLLRLNPGAEYPPHRHAGVEELFVLYGELWIDNRKLRAGDYSRAEAGSVHKDVRSEAGCTCLLVTSPEDAILGAEHTEFDDHLPRPGGPFSPRGSERERR